MFKKKAIPQKCSVIDSDVLLTGWLYEDDRTELKSPRRIEGCNSSHLCKVGSKPHENWSLCPYFGNEA